MVVLARVVGAHGASLTFELKFEAAAGQRDDGGEALPGDGHHLAALARQHLPCVTALQTRPFATDDPGKNRDFGASQSIDRSISYQNIRDARTHASFDMRYSYYGS